MIVKKPDYISNTQHIMENFKYVKVVCDWCNVSVTRGQELLRTNTWRHGRGGRRLQDLGEGHRGLASQLRCSWETSRFEASGPVGRRTKRITMPGVASWDSSQVTAKVLRSSSEVLGGPWRSRRCRGHWNPGFRWNKLRSSACRKLSCEKCYCKHRGTQQVAATHYLFIQYGVPILKFVYLTGDGDVNAGVPWPGFWPISAVRYFVGHET